MFLLKSDSFTSQETDIRFETRSGMAPKFHKLESSSSQELESASGSWSNGPVQMKVGIFSETGLNYLNN